MVASESYDEWLQAATALDEIQARYAQIEARCIQKEARYRQIQARCTQIQIQARTPQPPGARAGDATAAGRRSAVGLIGGRRRTRAVAPAAVWAEAE